nr:kinesin-like motor protein 9 [Quercus suber]
MSRPTTDSEHTTPITGLSTISTMDTMSKPSTTLFDVFLRLRPSAASSERFLDVERAGDDEEAPTHITIKPPTNDHRKRAIERFAFTQVFEEHAGQRELLDGTGALGLLEGVLGAAGREGRDGLLATLGVTGSGKSHTILGSKSQRGLTQLTLDVLFAHTQSLLVDLDTDCSVYPSLCASDLSEAQIIPAAHFLESVYSDAAPSRGATPALESSFLSAAPTRKHIPRLSTLPSLPSVADVAIDVDTSAEYAVLVSMYEVYNDRIFDLLTGCANGKAASKRRALLFKSTENSPDRKVVAGLRKVVCSTLEDALLVLETGLQERRVAGTGSNAVSSRSHGFFCVDIKKRHRATIPGPWTCSTMTVVDLAGKLGPPPRQR